MSNKRELEKRIENLDIDTKRLSIVLCDIVKHFNQKEWDEKGMYFIVQAVEDVQFSVKKLHECINKEEYNG